MRKHLLRSWLLVCAVVLGFAQSWADDITSLPFNVNFTVEDNSTSPFDGGAVVTGTNLPDGVLSLCGATAKAYFDVDAATEGRQAYVLSDNEEVTMSFVAYHGWENKGKPQGVKLLNSQGVVIASYEYTLGDCNITDVKIGGQTVVGFAPYNAQGYFNGSKSANGLTHSQSYQAGDDKNIQITFSLHKLGVVTINIKKEVSGLDKTYTGLLDADVAKDLAAIEAYSGSTTADRALCIDNLSITTATVEKVVARYTVNYVCGEEIIKSESLEGLEGAEPAISTAAIYANGNKYIYESNDAETVGALSGSEDKVYTVHFKKAAVGNVLIQTNGKGFKKIENVFDGDDVTFWMPYYLFLETTKEAVLDEGGNEVEPAKTYTGFFKLADSKRLEGKYGQFTVTFVKPNRANNMPVNIEYTEEENSNAVFYAEAEDIETLTKYQDNFTEIRMSNGAAAYAEADGAIVANVEAGAYIIEAASRSGNTYFSVNGKQILAVESTGSVVTPTANFQVKNASDITVSAGSASNYFDYVLIRRTGDYVPVYKDVEVAPVDGDIAVAVAEAQGDADYVNNVTVTLTKGAKYTISKSITAGGNIFINGNGATIDASALTAPFIVLNGTTKAATQIDSIDEEGNPVTSESTSFKSIESVQIDGVTITGLKKALVRDEQKTLVDNLLVNNSNIEVVGNASIIDFASKGYPTVLKVLNSTLWSKEGHTGFFAQLQNRLGDVDKTKKVLTETIAIENSTLYNISYGKKMNNLNQKGQTWMKFVLKNSIFYNVSTADPLNGWNGGQDSPNPTMVYENNTYWSTDGVVAAWTAETKVNGDGSLSDVISSDKTGTSIACDPGFVDAANGDFTISDISLQAKFQTGDPRWLVEYNEEKATVIDNATVNTVSTGAIYNLAGQKVSSNFKGIVIMNGKKVMVK